MNITTDSKIYVAGHRGMVGSALVRRLRAGGFDNLVLRTRVELDLLDRSGVRAFMAETRPDYVFIAAARVGGIQANDRHRADFLHDNLVIDVVHDRGNPDGTPQELLDVSRMDALDWHAKTPLREDMAMAYAAAPFHAAGPTTQTAGTAR